MPLTLWDDTKAVVTEPASLVALALAGIGGAAIRSSDLDDRVSDHYEKHRQDMKILGMNVVPYIDPERNLVGLALVRRW